MKDRAIISFPFALSLSKGSPFLLRARKKEERDFDKLSPNGREKGC